MGTQLNVFDLSSDKIKYFCVLTIPSTHQVQFKRETVHSNGWVRWLGWLGCWMVGHMKYCLCGGCGLH